MGAIDRRVEELDWTPCRTLRRFEALPGASSRLSPTGAT